MATSGTVGTTVFKTRKIIDHAFRRCGMIPQQITSEHLETAQDLLFLVLSSLGTNGTPLWTVNKLLLPMYDRVGSVSTPLGTIDVLDINLRTAQRQLGEINSASEGTADDAFDSDLSTACTQVAAAGWIQTVMDSAVSIPIFGILPNASGSWDFDVQYSDDGITWTTLFSEAAYAMVAGTWYWRDVEGVPEAQYWRLQATGTTVLDVKELVFQNQPTEIPMYKLNRTDYNNLPNKTFTGRPLQFWFDKEISQPVLRLWPVPSAGYTFSQITGYSHRQIQDVGTLQEEIEVPQRWYLAIVLELAKNLVTEIKEADINRAPVIFQQSSEETRKAWGSESDGSVVRLLPRISPYTR